MAPIADAFVRVRADTSSVRGDVRKGLDGARPDALGHEFGRKAGGGFSSAFGGAMTKAAGAAAAAFAAVKVGGFLKDAIGQASDLGETVSKVGQIFGPAAGDIQKFASTAATSLGQTKQQALDANATFGIFGKSAGLAGKDLSGFTTRMASLATDMASFNNTSPEDAITAIGAALRGESEPIRAYGVLLDDASLRQEALRQGLIKTTKTALTPQQRVLASQALILKQTKDQQGDFARTSGGLANQQRILSARFSDFKTSLGGVFLPLTVRAVSAIAPLASRVAGLVTRLREGGGGLGGFGAKLGQLLPRLREFASSVAGRVVPMVKDLAQSFKVNVVPALRDLANFLISQVIPNALTLANILNATAVPAVKALGETLFSVIGFVQRNQSWLGPIIAGVGAFAGALWLASAATTAYAAVVRGVMAVTKIWTGVQAVFNLVMMANPFVLAAAAVIGLGAAFVIAYKKSETFRNIINGLFGWVKAHWPLLLGILLGPIGLAVVGIVKYWGAIKGAFSAGYGAVRGFLSAHWPLLLAILSGPIGLAAFEIHKHWAAIKGTFSSAVNAVRGFLAAHWTTILAILTGPLGLMVLATVKFWGSMRGTVSAGVASIRVMLTGFASTVRSKATEAWTGFLTETRTILGKVVTFVRGVPAKLAGGLSGLGGLLVDKMHDGLRPLLQFIDSALVGNLNKILDHLPGGFHIGNITPNGFAKGGVIPGRDTGVDSVLIHARPGEGILTPETVKKLGGLAAIEDLNRWGLQGFSAGGVVRAIGRGAKATGSFVLPDAVGNMIQKGLVYAVDHLMDPVISHVRGAFGGNFVGDTGVGAMMKAKALLLPAARKTEAANANIGIGGAAVPGGLGAMLGAMPGGFHLPLPPGSYSIGVGLGGYPGHKGQDLPAPRGTPVFAPMSGYFLPRTLRDSRGNYRSYGNMANVFGRNGLQFIGGHLLDFSRGAGLVNAGAQIGRVDSTGHSSGDHLHAEWRRNGQVLNPWSVMRYDKGGILDHGSMAINTSRRPEAVLDPSETIGLKHLAAAARSGNLGGRNLTVNVSVPPGRRKLGYEIGDAVANTVVLNGWA